MYGLSILIIVGPFPACRSTAVSIKYALKQTVVKCFTELCCLKADKSLKTVGEARRQTIVYTNSYVLI